MNIKSVLSLVFRVAALTIIQVVCFAIAGSLAGPAPAASQPPEAAGATLLPLLLVCLLNTLVLALIIQRSRWHGWRLALTMALIFYGVMTFMSQIESAVFLTRLPAGMLPRLFLMGALITIPFSPLAVLMLGRWRPGPEANKDSNPVALTSGEWLKKLSLISAIYLVLYFTFGYYIAWKNPAVTAYYGGVDEGSFVARKAAIVSETPWLPPFQVLRAVLWVLLALPVIRMMGAKWQWKGLAVALLFAVVMNAQLLLPNPYMPEAVRWAHLVETASSNFIFGFLVVWLFHRHHASLPDLFRLRPAG